ncbi:MULTISPECIES: RNA methyltransferase [unclassified Polaromonas]|uniref:TrmH family RNA methyltransferase n=1 Tax=unclassified Polaromonas TaxID=2638319 RepID=UPI000BD4A2AF|nr:MULTISPECIES: RNA methyltransferase [unclassified Polaromonas]OYY39089.1 MAG: rRNA methyltransferase [Polaromonas sp. 35-63-35]OYZ21954.1 MAG: rRNA methyltransferase [Polaromonas sp. 16-63-31]OYZ80391.1 MAG: rRNA methyltransferase [Polaromonas sp. 24-63-21]OZA51455.1 MAG: rRNA methyltransferase [Polaromonas sp. 17-63-33]OZA90074.1 MAG: rRNA methyltransferase [Polaromonas sp. 39-63-25]
MSSPAPAAPVFVTSRDNALVKDLRRLSQDSTAYRKQGRVWLEGDHLCRAALLRGLTPAMTVFSESFWPLAPAEWAQAAIKTIVISDALLPEISGLESPARMGFVIDLPAPAALSPGVASLILDRVQDAGNVGSMLRSASAFGFSQVIALRGTAALWSPKVLRAGMGAHFGLQLLEGVEPQALDGLTVPIIVTSSHDGAFLHRQALPMPCAWAMGHEGQGVGDDLMARASLKMRIDQPGGEESLNVAAAAAICLYASSVAATR